MTLQKFMSSKFRVESWSEDLLTCARCDFCIVYIQGVTLNFTHLTNLRR